MLIGISTGTIYGVMFLVVITYVFLRHLKYKGLVQISDKWMKKFLFSVIALLIVGCYQVLLHINNVTLKQSKNTLISNNYVPPSYAPGPPTNVTARPLTLEEMTELHRKRRLEQLEEQVKLK